MKKSIALSVVVVFMSMSVFAQSLSDFTVIPDLIQQKVDKVISHPTVKKDAEPVGYNKCNNLHDIIALGWQYNYASTSSGMIETYIKSIVDISFKFTKAEDGFLYLNMQMDFGEEEVNLAIQSTQKGVYEILYVDLIKRSYKKDLYTRNSYACQEGTTSEDLKKIRKIYPTILGK